MELGGPGNPDKVASSGLPERLQRVIGDKRLLGSGCQGALHMLRSWHAMLLLAVGPGIGSQCKGFTWERGKFDMTGFVFVCLLVFFSITMGSVEYTGSHNGIGAVGVFQKALTNACTAVGGKKHR